jgi:HSP20 family protein
MPQHSPNSLNNPDTPNTTPNANPNSRTAVHATLVPFFSLFHHYIFQPASMLAFRTFDNAWPEISRLHRSMGSIFQQLHDNSSPFAAAPSLGSASWSPSCDVRETENAIELQADLPGVKRDDIEINIDQDILTVRGQRSHQYSSDNDTSGDADNQEHPATYHVTERQWGSFSRAIRLPRGVDTSAIDASYADGVLHVTIPKPTSPVARTTRIAVRDRVAADATTSSSSATSTTSSSEQ